ncbi:MAG: ferric reductase-like transmembrane domain-containing protein [Anaerolineales bacterium]|nr:ferric reductase-like transmembrane domain-containing protein [Anaerolineales bacterium]
MTTISKASPTLIEKIDIIPSAAILAAVITWVLRQAPNSGDGLPVISLWVILAVFIIIAIAITHSKSMSKKAKQKSLSFLAHFGAWLPISFIFWQFYYWEYLNGRWAHEATFFAGKMAITLLVLSLAVTPFMTMFGWKELNPLRKPLGLYAFMLVCIHLLIFTYDYGYFEGAWAVGLAFNEAVTKQYALVGLVAFLLLIPLAVTSNNYSIKQLKKNWKKLHQLVYIIAILASVHFIWVWAAKRAFTEPLIYAAIIIILLLVRLKPIKQRIIRMRQEFSKRRRARTA